MNMRCIAATLLVAGSLLSPHRLVAANPILSGYADPHMKIWNGRMYISVGKDKDPEIKGFCMPHWSIYSSDDLVRWIKETDIDPKDTYIGEAINNCWATDIAMRGDNYYFYFSKGGAETGLMVADRPSGPWRDVLNKPFIAAESSVNHEYDPTLFEDDDRAHYIIFGRDGFDGKHLLHYQIARLSDDMLSLAEPPRDLRTDSPFGFGEENRARDHQYFHKHNGLYYLSCAGAYRTSTNIYGPFTNLRMSGQNPGHSSFVEYNGQTYHMFEFTCEPYGNRSYRQVSLIYVHYKDNGDMVDDPLFIQGVSKQQRGKYYATGVANYEAGWEKIEAEWFFKRTGALVKSEGPSDGFELRNIRNGDSLSFPKVKGLRTNSRVSFRVSSANPQGGTIHVHLDNPSGALLGSCPVPSTQGWDNYQEISAELVNAAGSADLCLVFEGGEDELMRLDWMRFE